MSMYTRIYMHINQIIVDVINAFSTMFYHLPFWFVGEKKRK